jgi:hypothetical protein
MFSLYYNPFVPVKSIVPEMTVELLLETANQAKEKIHPTAWDLNLLANLVRLNWMIQDLKYGFIYKPLLVKQNLEVLTGDTRMMAISFHSHIEDVPCVLTVPSSYQVDTTHWIPIKSINHLSELTGVAEQDILFNDVDWTKQQLSWIEFAMPNTEHHMHDQQQRENMILEYLKHQDDAFVFSRDWLADPIDWSTFDNF